MKKFITLLIALILCFSAFGCSRGVEIGIYATQVECGKYLRIPELIGIDSEDVTVKVTDPNNKNVKITRNSILLEIEGDYKINYQYKGGSKTITVKCTPDVSAPYMENSFNMKKIYQVGSVFAPDGGDLADPSGVDKTVSGIRHMEFYYEDETTPFSVGTSFVIEKAGNYTVKVPAVDKLGNATKYEYEFKAIEPFYDNDLKQNYLADFNEDGYLDLLGSSGLWGDYTDEYEITADYPGAQSGSSNKVLSAKADSNGPHYLLRMSFLNEVPVSDVKYVFIRFLMEERTGFNASGTLNYADFPPAIYGIPYSLSDARITTYLEPSDGSKSSAHFFTFEVDEWGVARIPVSKLLVNDEKTLKGIKLCVCGNLYIDEIWYSNEEFVDNNVEPGVLADFDEEGWLYQVGKANVGDSPSISLMLENYPEPTVGSGVLKVSSNSLNSTAGVQINLFETVSASEHQYVYFRIYYDGRVEGVLQVKSKVVFQNSALENHQDERLFEHVISETNVSQYQQLWKEIAVPSTVFAGYRDTFNTISILVEGQLYIDKIWVE